MNNRSIFVVSILSLLFISGSIVAQQKLPTVRGMMRLIEDKYDVNFVYESELDLDVVYVGAQPDSGDIDKDLKKLFRGSGINWKRNGKYVILTKAAPQNIDLEEERRDTLDASRIISDKFRRARTQTGLTAVDSRKFNQGYATLSSPDLIKTLQGYPGVQSGVEMLAGFYVHGGTGRDNLFLLDGAPIYQVSHLAGIFSSFNTDIIETTDFYKSGFPARFGGRLSSVVDVTTKDGDFNEYHGSFSIGLLDGRLQYEGPIIKGKTSFNFSMRRSWIDLIAYPTLAIVNSTSETKTNMGYSFHDLNAKITHKFSEGNRLSLNFFSGKDALKYGYIKPSRLTLWNKETEESEVHEGQDENNLRMNWGNLLTSLNWKSRVNDEFNYSAVLYYTRCVSDMDYYDDSWTWNNINENYHSISENRAYMILDDVSAKADFVWNPHEKHHLRFGGQYIFHRYLPQQFLKQTNKPDIGSTTVDSSGGENLYLAHESGVYIEDEMNLMNWLDVTLGLRYSMFAVNGKVWNGLEPRLAVNVSFNENIALKVSYVEMNQYSHGIATTSIDLPTNFWLPATEMIRPMHSRQAAAEVMMNLPENIHLELGGFYRTLDHVYEYNGVNLFCPAINSWEREFSEGMGRAYGAEAAAGWSNGKIETNIYYTLSWSERKFDDFYYDWYYDRNDCRHKLTMDISYKINERIDLYAAWNYHTGNRVTFADQYVESDYILDYGGAYGSDLLHYMFYSEPNNLTLPDYHRLDIGANFRKTTKRGNERIWNVSLYNAYCRMNPFTVVDYIIGSDGKPYAKLTGIFPIIPSFSYTLKF